MSALKEMFSELRAEGKREEECINVIADRLGENPVEARRILTVVGGVKLGGGKGRSGERQRGDRGRSGVAKQGARRRAQAID